MKYKLSLQVKQLLIIVLIVFLPTLAQTVYSSVTLARMTYREQQLLARQRIQSVSQSFNMTASNFNEISQWVIGNENFREFLLVDGTSAVEYDSAYNQALKNLSFLPYSSRSYASLFIFRNDGRYIRTGELRSVELTESEKEQARQLKGGWFWSVSNSQLSMCRLYRDTQDLSHHLGYIKLVMNPNQILATYQSMAQKYDEYYILLSNQGEILHHNVPQEIYAALPSAEVSAAAQGEQLTLNLPGSDRYLVLMHSTPTENDVVSVIGVCLYKQITLRDARYRPIMQGVIAVLVVSVLQFFMTSRYFISPLKKLTRLMKSIEAEDYSVRFRVKGNDEIAQVCTQFNRMSERLQSLYEEVYQSKLKAREAEILALQAEINPHFMFNTLDSLYWMVNLGDKDKALGMICALSDSFRCTLTRTTDGFVTLETAIKQAGSYLYIQQMRLQDRLHYEMDVDDSLHLKHTMVLHLVLQPIIENAIKHGLEPDGGGEVMINIYLSDRKVIYSVYDTGSTVDENEIQRALLEPRQGSHGLALYNIRSRLQLKFGTDYGVSFHRTEDHRTLFTVTQPLYLLQEDGSIEPATDDC